MQEQAFGILDEIVQHDPRYRDLVFEQLAALAPENAAYSSLPPLQALAVAWTKMQSIPEDKDKDPDSQKVLAKAIDAADAVIKNNAASLNNRKEALLISALANGRLGHRAEAARMDLDFADLCVQMEKQGSAKDPRAKELVNLALNQIGELRAAAAGGALPKEVSDLALRATAKAADLGEHQWDYAHILLQIQKGNLREAALGLQGMSQSDPHYIESRYQLLR